MFKRLWKWWNSPSKFEEKVIRRLYHLQESVNMIVEHVQNQPMPLELKAKLAELDQRRRALEEALASDAPPTPNALGAK